MSPRGSALALALLVCFDARTSEAQRAGAGVVTCTEAVHAAWSNAPRVRAANALRAVSAARRDELRAGYIPQVNAAAIETIGFGGSGSNLGVRGMVASPFVNHWAAGIEASWSALEVLRIEPRVELANAEEAAAKADEARIQRDVALMVVDVYERVLLVESQLDVTDADITSRKAHVGAVEALVGGGIVPETDLLAARASVAKIEANRVAIDANRDGLRNLLVTLGGDTRLSSAKLVLDADRAEDVSDPDAALARAERDAASRQRGLVAREWFPRLVLGGSAGYAHTPRGQDPGLWAAGAAIVFPLTGTFAESAREEQAAFLAESRAHEADAHAQELAIRRATLKAALRGFEAGIPAAAFAERAARQALEAVEARAAGGLARELEVESARLAVVEATVAAAALRVQGDATRARLAWIGD